MIHDEPSKLAGQACTIVSESSAPFIGDLKGKTIAIEDWWDRVTGGSWMDANGNPAAMLYGIRSGILGLPADDEVLYGKIGGLGILVHISELSPEEANQS